MYEKLGHQKILYVEYKRFFDISNNLRDIAHFVPEVGYSQSKMSPAQVLNVDRF